MVLIFLDKVQAQEKWQAFWEEDETFRPRDDGSRERRYVLDMFPYPSGDLHMGHAEAYAIGDAMARYWFQLGRNVLHPIGWDAFGLPAENAAIRNNAHPADWTYAPVWFPAPLPPSAVAEPLTWLVLADDEGLADGVTEGLRADGHRVTTVRMARTSGAGRRIFATSSGPLQSLRGGDGFGAKPPPARSFNVQTERTAPPGPHLPRDQLLRGPLD